MKEYESLINLPYEKKQIPAEIIFTTMNIINTGCEVLSNSLIKTPITFITIADATIHRSGAISNDLLSVAPIKR